MSLSRLDPRADSKRLEQAEEAAWRRWSRSWQAERTETFLDRTGKEAI